MSGQGPAHGPLLRGCLCYWPKAKGAGLSKEVSVYAILATSGLMVSSIDTEP